MKILLIRDMNPFWDSSASGNRFTSLITGLKLQGVDITVAITGGYSSKVEKQMGGTSLSADVNVCYVNNKLNHTLWRRRINKYLLGSLLTQLVSYRLKEMIAGYDIVWVTSDLSILKFYNKYHQKIKRSFIEINEFHDIYKQEGKTTNRLQVKYAQDVESNFLEALRYIDCVAAMTNTLSTYYKKLSKSTSKYIHLPMTVDFSRFEILKSAVESPYIAFAGSFDNRKDGLNILIEAFYRIHHRFPEYRLKIAGFYHADMKMQVESIKRYNLSEKVEYVGQLKRDEIPQFLMNASVLTLPRPDSHQAQGGFPTKLGEYLATKNPVCVTSVGEIPDYLEDGVSAFMAIPGDPDSFSDCLCRVLTSKQDAERVGRAGYELAKEYFDMEIQAERLATFLHNNLIP